MLWYTRVPNAKGIRWQVCKQTDCPAHRVTGCLHPGKDSVQTETHTAACCLILQDLTVL